MQALLRGNLNAGLFQKVGDYTVGGYLELDDHADWDIGNVTNATLSLFVRCTSSGFVNNEQMAMHYESNTKFWEFQKSNADGSVTFSHYNSGFLVQLNGGDISDGNWHHVAMCKVGANYGLYVNGIQVDYQSYVPSWTLAGTLIIGASSYIGHPTYLQYYNRFKGFLDCIQISHSNVFNASPNGSLTDTITVPTEYQSTDSNTKLLIQGRNQRNLGDYFIDEASGHIIYNKGVVASNVSPKFGNCTLQFNGYDGTNTGGETQIDITGLDGDETTEFLIESVCRGDTTGMNPAIRLNNDSGANYHSNRHLIYGVGVGSLISSPFAGQTLFPSINLNTALTTVGYSKMVLNARSGKVRTGTFQANGFGGVGTPHVATMEAISYSGTGKISQINLLVSGGGKLTGGSSIKIYARRFK